MKYKLLLLDIDGTLTASKGEALPTKAVSQAVQAAQDKLTVAVATGRPHEFAQPVLDALDLRDFGIFNGGAEIIHIATGKVEHEQLLSIEQLQELVRISLPFGYKIYTDADQYSNALQSPEDIAGPAAKFFIEAASNKDIPAMIDALNGAEGALAHPTTSWADGEVMDIHVTHELATKQHGAEKLIKLLGYHKDQVIAVGDGHNDIPLLEAAGLKVAMGNSPDEVKAIADYITGTLEEDGVAQAIEQFILAKD